MTTDRHAFTALLLGCTAVSLAGNVAYAVERDAVTPVSIALAAVAPILLPVGVHYIPKANRVRCGARFVVTVAVMVAAVAAFVLSFEALSGLMRMHGHSGWTAYLLPVAVDVLAAAAAYALVVEPEALAEQSAVHRAPERPAVQELTYPDTLTWMTAPPAEQAAPERPAEQVRDSAPQPPREVAPTAVQADPLPVVHRPAQPARQSLTSEDVDTAPIAVQAGQRPDPQRDPRPVRPAGQVAPTAVDTAEQADPQLPRFEVHRDGLAPAPRPAPVAPRDPEDIAVHRATAEHLVTDGRTAATVEQVTRVLEMTAQGASQRTIATEVGISSTAVGRIQAAARELAEASA
ncbi:DUF2637 domain-containing protein [Mycobacteroides abscessus]|uniref:DUF2637 domain-containing protein n=1 Tax=Mycobacteroides abscessus TaxID=36809 RepID=UPI00092BC03A|nr:DUF2637 domain-containing protein [Mycobacteroides abscessus]SIJ93541.1 Protein of uncharacterised function (DUF2637) [Mycobacteroides abscessus subsp. abscessus]